MTFRKINNSYHKNFITAHRQKLLDLRIPLSTMELRAWQYLLDHGDCAETGWSMHSLNHNQLAILLDLVNEYDGNNDRSDVNTWIEHTLKTNETK